MKSISFATALTTTLLISASAFAANSGTLILSGKVNSRNDLVVTPNADATNLNILGGETNKLVGTATETSNNHAGYKVQASSANGGFLVNGYSANYKTAYKLSYGGQTAMTLTNDAAVVKNVTSLNGLTTNTSDIKVDVTAMPNAVAGTYSDTVTLTIIAN